MFTNKFITAEFLCAAQFICIPDGSYCLDITLCPIHSIVVHVDIISTGIAVMVGIKDHRSPYYTVLPIQYESQLNKLVAALKGV